MNAWDAYLRGFHDERPGVTEAVLGRCRTGAGTDPYEWLLAGLPPLPGGARVLDLACGNAPQLRYLSDGFAYVGVDRSAAELRAAPRLGNLVQGDAAALPLASAGIEIVVCSMGLMVVSPLPAVLAEIRRVLVPGGHLVATVPATRPLVAPMLSARAASRRGTSGGSARSSASVIGSVGFGIGLPTRDVITTGVDHSNRVVGAGYSRAAADVTAPEASRTVRLRSHVPGRAGARP